MNQLRPLNPFNNVVASGIANCDLNPLLGTTLECLNLTLGGGAFSKSNITLIQLKANGKVIWESDGTKADATEAYMNYATLTASILHINFMEQKAKTVNAFQSGAIDLSVGSGITSLRLEVTTSGATTPTLTGVAEVSPAVAVRGEEAIRYLLARRHRNTQTIGAAGTFSLQVPHLDPAGGGSVYKRINIFSANITAIKAQREGIAEFDLSATDMAAIQKKAGRAPQANLLVFDTVLDGIQSGRVWDTRPAANVRSAQLYGTFSAGETITIETQELLPLSAY
ncbi:MAG: hypothetical protein JWQ72_2649 [Polaromonas sp.]|nr:hypothetical protein [Polaromonas sp.]